MKFLKSATNLIFLAVIFLLVAALVCTTVVIINKNRKIDQINAIIAQNELEIVEITDKEAELTKRLKESQETNSKTEAALSESQKKNEQLEKEKKQLEEENGQLKNKIEELSAQKKDEAQAALNAAAAQSPVPPGSKVCYLTFDDGPSENTLKILEILDRYNAKATFFVINTSKISYVKMIHEAGHTIGLHSASHRYDLIYKSTDAYFADLGTISAKVEQLTGVKSNIIRFPGGGSNAVSKKYCKGIMTQLTALVKQKGYYYFDWNVDSSDASSAKPAPEIIIKNVLNQAKNKSSICVLMHDSQEKTTTVTALPTIIEGLTAQGYRFEALTIQSSGYHHRVNN